MAKAKFGMIVTDMRNKLGGHVFTKNRAGAIVRTKVTPSNPQTTFQSAVRNRFTGFAQAWRGLTEDQRNAWNAAVVNYQRTDIFGDLRSPSGINLYQRLNNILSVIGVAALTDPPLPSYVEAISLATLSAAVAVPAMSITLDTAIASECSCILSATPPMSAGRSFVKSQFRIIDILDDGDTSPVNILAKYIAKFGSTGEIGQKIFVKLLPTNNATGQVGSASILSVITVA